MRKLPEMTTIMQSIRVGAEDKKNLIRYVIEGDNRYRLGYELTYPTKDVLPIFIVGSKEEEGLLSLPYPLVLGSNNRNISYLTLLVLSRLVY